MYSTGDGGFYGTGFDVIFDKWYFIAVVGEGDSPTSSTGRLTFYVGDEMRFIKLDGVVDGRSYSPVERVLCGTEYYRIGWPDENPGPIGQFWAYPYSMDDVEVENLYATSIYDSGYYKTGCQLGWYRYDDYCYFFSQEDQPKISWEEAENICIGEGGHLASVHSRGENAFLESYKEDDAYWIGLHDPQGDGTWGWSDNTSYINDPENGANWNEGEPNKAGAPGTSGAEDCVEILYREEEAGSWNDVACERLKYYICKKKFNSSDTPDATTTQAPDNHYSESLIFSYDGTTDTTYPDTFSFDRPESTKVVVNEVHGFKPQNGVAYFEFGDGAPTVGQYYTHVYWVQFTDEHNGWKTLFRNDNDHDVLVLDGASELGMYSNRDNGFHGTGFD
eukprot:UN30141